jgi:hypothetical protein
MNVYPPGTRGVATAREVWRGVTPNLCGRSSRQTPGSRLTEVNSVSEPIPGATAPTIADAIAETIARRQRAEDEQTRWMMLGRRGEVVTNGMAAVRFHSPDTGPEYSVLCKMKPELGGPFIEEWVEKFMTAARCIATEELCGVLADDPNGDPLLRVALGIYRDALAEDRSKVARHLAELCGELLSGGKGHEWGLLKDALGTVAERVCIAWNVRREELRHKHSTTIVAEANQYESALATAVEELTNYLGSYDANPSTYHDRFTLAIGTINRTIPVLACHRDVGALCPHWSESTLNDRRELYRRILVGAFHLLRGVVGHHLPETLLPAVTQEINEVERSVFAILEWYDWDWQASDARGRLATLARCWWPLMRSGEPPIIGTRADTVPVPPAPRGDVLPVASLVEAMGLPASCKDKVSIWLRRLAEDKPDYRSYLETPRHGEEKVVYRVALVWPQLLEMLPRWRASA